MTQSNGNKPHNDKLEILTQTGALTNNPEQFYREIIYALSDSISLEQFHIICNAALNTTAEARSLHED